MMSLLHTMRERGTERERQRERETEREREREREEAISILPAVPA